MGRENFLIKTTGGPHPGVRVANTGVGPDMDWPLPELLADEGGAYVKINESKMDPIEPGSHIMRGAEYEWRPEEDENGSV